jgi:rod shape-determining protein MreD
MRTEKKMITFVAKVLAAGLLIEIFESTFLNAVNIAGMRPDLLLLVILLASRRTSFRRLLTLAFILGLVRDFFSPGVIGMNAFALTMIAYLVLLAEEFVLAENWTGHVLLGFTGALVYGACIVLLKALLNYEIGSVSGILKTILGNSFYTAAAAPAFFIAFSKPHALPYFRLKLKHLAEHESIPEVKT